jgi:hypothetical protein
LFALGFRFGYATVGLVLTLRRPANPIGWLYAAAALTWSLVIPLGPWLDQLVRDRQPLPLAAQLTALGQLTVWAPAIALGITLPALLVPDGPDRHGGQEHGGRRPGPPLRLPARRPALRDPALPGLPRGRAPADALGRHRGRRRPDRPHHPPGEHPGRLARPGPGPAGPSHGGGGRAALPPVGPGPAGQPDRHLRRRDRPAARPLPAGRPGRLGAGGGVGQPGRGRHPGRGRPVPAAAAPGPGPGRPPLQPAPLRRRPDRRRVRAAPPRPGGPGRPAG